MKIIFNLKELNITQSGKTTIDRYGNVLSNRTLNSILSFIVKKYTYSKYEMAQISAVDIQHISAEYKIYLTHLYNTGVILWNEYKPGVKYRGYYLTDFFKNRATILKIELEKDDTEIVKEKYNNDIDKSVDIKLRTDFKSLQIVDAKIEKEVLINSEDVFIYNFKGYIASFKNLQMIKEKNIYYKWTSGRLYTNFCSCGKKVRLNNFDFSGDKLGTLDIPSSHPLWLAIWAIEKGVDKHDYDFKMYCNDVSRLKIYDTIRVQLNKIKDIGSAGDDMKAKAAPYYSRATSKIAFMKWINGEEKNDIVNNMFKIYYETLYKIVDRKKYKMYDELVKLETNFIMNIVVKELYKIRGIKIITCHDQIYFQEKYKEKVEEIWNIELEKIYEKLPML